MAVDPQEIIRRRAIERAFDPYAALAVSIVESGGGRSVYGDVDDPANGIDPRSVRGPDGRWYTSLGPFQERVVNGAGETHLRSGGTLADLFDPLTATDRFIDRYRAAETFLGFGATPGRVAAEAQRPADRSGYAQRVDATYQQLARGEQASCPAGMVRDPRTGACVWVGRGGVIPQGSEPERHPGIAGEPRVGSGGSDPVPGAERPGRGAADFDPLRDVAGAIDRAREGATQLAIGVAVVGVAVVLGYSGLKRILD